jgi:hypothetical protein
LYLSTSGLNTALPVTVDFSGPSNYSTSQAPIRVASDGTVVVGVPLYFDPVSNQTAPATMSVSLAQNGQTTASVTIQVQDLPSVSSYGVNPGDISRAYLNLESMVIARRINEFQAAQDSPKNTVDTTAAQSQLSSLLTAQIASRSDVERVATDSTLTISAGTLPNGTALQFDASSLDMMDRIYGLYLQESSQTIVGAASVSGTSLTTNMARLLHRLRHQARLRARRGRFGQSIGLPRKQIARRGEGGSLDTTLKIIGTAGNITALTQAYADGAAKDATMIDKVLAVSSGIGAAFNEVAVFAPALTKPAAALGALNASLGLLDNFGKEIGAFGYLLVNCTNSSLGADDEACTEAANDIEENRGQAIVNTISAEENLLTLVLPTQIVTTLNTTSVALQGASFVTSLASCYVDSQCANLVSSVSSSVVNEVSSLTGTVDQFGQAVGNAIIQNTLGAAGALPEIEFYSGDSFDALADPNGGYDLLLPLNDPNFDYKNTGIEAIDPETQTVLGSATVDLSGILGSGMIQVPTLTGVCIDTDSGDPDGDDPDCDN